MFNVCSMEDVGKVIKTELDAFTQDALKKALADFRTQLIKELSSGRLKGLAKQNLHVAATDENAPGFDGASAKPSISKGLASSDKRSTFKTETKQRRRPKRALSTMPVLAEEEIPPEPLTPIWESEPKSPLAFDRRQCDDGVPRQEATELMLAAPEMIAELRPSLLRVSFSDSMDFGLEEPPEKEGLLQDDRDLPAANTMVAPRRKCVGDIVTHPVFEPACGMLVLFNACFMGMDVSILDPETAGSLSAELFFCIVFLAELVLRILYEGPIAFYFGEDWGWAWFDTFIVGLQLVDQLATFLSHAGVAVSVGSVMCLRMLRLLRVLRLTRILRHFPVLAVVSKAMTSSLPTTLYSLSVVALLVYAFSVVFVQALTGACKTSEALDTYFGTLSRTSFTLLASISGGIGWEDVLMCLLGSSCPLMGIAFLFYLTLTSAGCLSMALGIIMDSFARIVRDDRDVQAADRIKYLFTDSKGELHWEDFTAKLNNPIMQDYFRSIGVSPTLEDAKFIFELLDEDGGGSLSLDEMIAGCIRLRGPAKSLDTAILLKDVSGLIKDVEQLLRQNCRIYADLDTAQLGLANVSNDLVILSRQTSPANAEADESGSRRESKRIQEN